MYRIQIVGDINQERYASFSKELAELESKNCKKVFAELCSDGGDAYTALAFYSRIRTSKCQIHIHATGCVMSAAVLILAAGHHRTMDETAWVMVHEDSGKLSGSVVDLERDSKQMRKLEDQWNNILEKRTGIKAVHWSHYHKDTTYLTAAECQNLCLIDKVIEND